MKLNFLAAACMGRAASQPDFKTTPATKTLLIMKLTAILLLVTCLQVSAKVFSQQQLTVKVKDAPLVDVITDIGKQSGYQFFANERLLKDAKKVTVNLEKASLEQVLDACFKDQELDYAIVDKTVVIKRKKEAAVFNTPPPPILINGTITSENNVPLEGASIKIKGTNKTVVSNNKGEFAIEVALKDVLQISYVGYLTQEIAVNESGNLKITLQQDVQKLDETVVIGYGSQRKANLTSAVSTLKATEIALIPTSNLSNVLAGRVSGTFVQSNTGTPGVGSSVRVRAQSSWNGGDAVYVIDGVVRDKTIFDALDPNEVDEISVLKDAASAAIYGSRSSNGVILVTTKTGKSGAPAISYSSTFSLQKTGKVPEYLDLTTSINMNRYIFGESSITPEEEADVKSWNGDGKAWYDAAYQDPFNQRHALSIAGGSDKITYYLGGSFYDEDGFLPNVWYKKYNLRGNISAKVTKDLTMGLILSNSYGTRNRFNFTYDYGSADLNNLWGKLFYNAFGTRPYVDGHPVDPGWLGNPVEMMKNGGYWRNNNQQIDALATLEYKVPFLPGLALKAAYSKNFNNSYTKTFAKHQLLYSYKMTANGVIDPSQLLGTNYSRDPSTEYIGNAYNKSNSYQFDGQISYDQTFGKHHINALAVYEQYEYSYNYFDAYRYNFPLFPDDQFFAASGNSADWTNSANENEDGRLSYIGRVNYEYANKYLFSASVRRDGSVKFAPSKRWGWFPSVAAGWKISEEDFFKQSRALSFVNLLKLRLSFASTGNDAIGGWQWQDQYNIQGSSYYMGTNGTTNPRLAYSGIPNPDLTWEKSNSANLGLDLRLLNHFSFTAEFWKRHSYDILGSRILAIPAEFGASLPATNYGIINSKGLELELGYNNALGKDFQYNIKGNFSIATNKVIQVDVASNAIPVDDPNGKTLNYMVGYRSTGIYRTEADLAKLPEGFTILGQAPVLGMLSFEDVSGPDNTPDGKVDNYDRVKLANYQLAQAPVSYGLTVNLSYKGFTLDMLFAGLAGYKIFYNDAFSRNTGSYFVYTKFWEDYWTESNTDGKAPKPFPWGDSRATYSNNSSYNAYDGSFLRMKYLSLGYSLPAPLTKKIGFKSIQVFASGTNLFLLSKFKYYDPELSSFMSYPNMKVLSLGLNVNL